MKLMRKLSSVINVVLVIAILVTSGISVFSPTRSEAAPVSVWDKYSVKTEWEEGPWEFQFNSGGNAWGYPGYEFNKEYGTFRVTGDYRSSSGDKVYGLPNSNYELEARRNTNFYEDGRWINGYEVMKKRRRQVQVKDQLIESNIIGAGLPDNGLHTDGFWYVKKTIANETPILSITSSGDQTLYNDGGTFVVSGTISDADNDPVTITADIGGAKKSIVITDTASTKTWNLAWSGTEIPVGVHANPSISYSDGKVNSTSNYNGTLTVIAQVYYYWSKFSVVQVPSKYEQVRNYTNGDLIGSNTYVYYSNSFYFDTNTGRYRLTGDIKKERGLGFPDHYVKGKYAIPEYHAGTDYSADYIYLMEDINNNDKIYAYKQTSKVVEYGNGRGSLLESNIRAVQGTYPDDGIHTDGFWYVRGGTVPNNIPTISVTQEGNKSINQKNGTDTLAISGTVSDLDNEVLTISATLNGVTKKVSVTNTSTSRNWTLTWRTSEFKTGGEFTGIHITADDGRGGVATGAYVGKLLIDITPLAIWDKFTVASKNTYEETDWVYEGDEDREYGMIWTGPITYSFDSISGRYTVPMDMKEWITTERGPKTYTLYGTVDQGGAHFLRRWDIKYYGINFNSSYIKVYNKYVETNQVPSRGALVQANISDLDGTFPDNGIASDGYWYVKKPTTNMFPVLTVDNSDLVVNSKTTSLKLRGTVYDADGDTVSIQAKIGDVIKVASADNTGSTQSWELVWSASELTEGSYSNVEISANDGTDKDSLLYTGVIVIDKSVPAITVTPQNQQWTANTITIGINYFDATTGIDPNNRVYKLTQSRDIPLSWDSADLDQKEIILKDEGEWFLHTKAADLAGNEKTLVSGPYQLQSLPTTPDLKVNNAGANWLGIAWSLPTSAYTDGYHYTIENLTTGKSWSVDYPTDSIREEGLSSGTTYQYKIKASNHVGETEWSAPFNVITLPAAPEGLNVQAIEHDSDKVNISFNAVPSAEKYKLIIKKNSDIVYEHEMNSAGTYTVSGLEAGQQYTASVVAVNSGGQGEASVLGFLTLPSAPGEFKTAMIGESEISLSWNESPTASLYELHRYDSPIYSGPDLDYTDTGLESSTEYDYQVSAKNESGYGDIAYLNDLMTLPAQVPSVTISTYTESEFELNWEPVRGADGYGLTLDGVELAKVDSQTKSFKVSGLKSGTSYDLAVYATNRSGAGAAKSITARTIPGSVIGLKVDDIEETGATIGWDPVIGADKYLVEVDDNQYEVSGTTLKLSGLSGGHTYTLKVKAGNESGYGKNTQIEILTLPQAPNDVRVKGSTSKSVQLVWDPVQSAKSYTVSEKTLGEIGKVNESEITVSDLKPGETYYFSVKATNETGEGKDTFFTWITVPDTPGEIRVEKVGVDSVKLSWDPVDGANLYQILGDAVGPIETKENSITLEGLGSATRYSDVKLVPVNNGGPGEAKSVSTFVTLPSGDYKVIATPNQHEVKYEIDLASKNEIMVISYKDKEVYRGDGRNFVLKSLDPGTEVVVSVWTENEVGDQSSLKVVKTRTVQIPSSGGNNSGSTPSGGPLTPNIPNPNKEVPNENDQGGNDRPSTGNDNWDGFSFVDIDDLYNKDQVLSLKSRGVVKGDGDRFVPKRDITRAEFMAMIVRALDLKPKEAAEMRFEDIDSNSWYYKELKIAFANKVVDGISETEFRPNSPITREQAAKMLANALQNKVDGDKVFKDHKKIAYWAESEVKTLAALDIVQGYPDGTFKPKNQVNRAEGASFIYKFIEQVVLK